MKIKFTPSLGMKLINKIKSLLSFNTVRSYNLYDESASIPNNDSMAHRVLEELASGRKLSQWSIARILKCDRPNARATICRLRKYGFPIFNERVPNSRRTLYFMAKPNMGIKMVDNKVLKTMPVPHGKFNMKVER